MQSLKLVSYLFTNSSLKHFIIKSKHTQGLIVTVLVWVSHPFDKVCEARIRL